MKRSIPIVVALAALSTAPAAVRAQDSYSFTVAALGGIGGSFDARGEQDFDHGAFEAAFGMISDDRTLVMLRAGRLDLDDALDLEGVYGAELDFVTVAGEYRFRQPAYDFGVYLGLGGYRVTGEEFDQREVDERALGLAFGLTGDFDVTRRVSLVAEFSAHYTFLDRAELYGLALGGVALHF